VVFERTAPAVAHALLGPYPPAPVSRGDNSWEAVAARTEAIYSEALAIHG